MALNWLAGPNALLAAGLALIASPSAAQEPQSLNPTSPWNLRYEEDKCRLVRMFGENNQRVELIIDQRLAAPFFDVLLIGKPLENPRRDIIRLQFGPYEEAADRARLQGTIEDSDRAFVALFGVELGVPEAEYEDGAFVHSGIGEERRAKIEWLEVGLAWSQATRLDLDGFSEALSSLDDCSNDLVQHLGLDKEGQANIVEQPQILNIEKVAKAMQFPASFQRKGLDAKLHYLMTIAPTGKAVSCRLARSKRPAHVDDQACMTMMQVAKFEPGKDSEGKPRHATFIMKLWD